MAILWIVTASLGAGCSAGSRSVDETVSDAVLVTAIRQRFAEDPELAAGDLDVSVRGGVATLTGSVEREARRDRAERLARDVQGIREVRNLIRVRASGDPRWARQSTIQGGNTE